MRQDAGGRLGRLVPAALGRGRRAHGTRARRSGKLQAPLTAVAHRPVAQRSGGLVCLVPDRCADGMGEDPSGGFDEAFLLRELDALLDRLSSPSVEPSGSPESRVRGWRPPVAELHGEVESTRDMTTTDHESIQAVASSGPGGSVSRSATASSLARCASVVRPGHHEDVGQPAERLSLLLPLTAARAEAAAPPVRLDRLVDVVGQVALDRPQMEQIRALAPARDLRRTAVRARTARRPRGGRRAAAARAAAAGA